jgi:integrase
VPLPKQAVDVFRELHSLTGEGKMVFRGERHHDRAMSENTVNAAMRAMGFAADEVTGHGFRATAHTVRDGRGRACNRTEFVDQRREMLQTWADYLDQLRSGKDSVPPKRRRAPTRQA